MNYLGAWGPHINNITGGIFDKLLRWAPPVCVSLEHHREWPGVLDALRGRTFFVGREFQEYQPNFDDSEETGDPIQMARDHVAMCLRIGLRYDAWQGYNETPITTEDGMKRYAEFESERARLLHKHGMRACIGNLASGNPAQLSLMRFFLTAFREGAKYGAVFGHHGYGWPRPQDHDVWHPFRIELIYEGCDSHGWEGVPEEYRIPALYTEAGVDQGVEPGLAGQLGGWRNNYDSPEDYAPDLDVVSQRVLSKPYMIGCAHYCMSSNDAQWYGYDGWPDLMEYFAQNAQPEYRKVHYGIEPAFGADISQWQGRFPWNKLVNAGASFAFIRATVGLKTDPQFARNAEKAWEKSIYAGFYHYLMPNSLPEDQAHHFLNTVAPHMKHLPHVVDFEEKGLSAEWLKRYLVSLEGPSPSLLRYKPLIYTNWKSIVTMTRKPRRWLSRFPLWVAHWHVQKPMLPPPWKAYEFHQFTNRGKIPGYHGRLDLNRFQGSRAALLRKYDG